MKINKSKIFYLTLLSIFVSACGGNSDSTELPKPVLVAGNLSLSEYDDTGISATDFISQDNNFSLMLKNQTQGVNIVYQLSKDAGKTWEATIAKQENLLDGNYQFKAIVKDSVGQEVTSNIINITVDRAAPIIKTVTIQNIDENQDGVSDYSLVKGTTEANIIIMIKTDGQDIGGAPVYADTNGQFSLEVPVRRSGENFNIQAQDIAGNISVVSTAQALIEKSIYSATNVSEIAGVYQLGYNFTTSSNLKQYMIVDEQGMITILNDKNSNFYTNILVNPKNCYGLAEVGTPNWKLQANEIYKKQVEDKIYYINVNGVEYKFDQNLNYLHDDGPLARYSSVMPADINYGSVDWLLFPFTKSDISKQSLLNQVCTEDKNKLNIPVYPKLIDAREVSGVFNSSASQSEQSYTTISEHGKISVYQYNNTKKCYIRPSVMQTNFDVESKYLSKDTQGFHINQPYATTGFGTMAWIKITLQPLNNKENLKVEGDFGQLFEPDTSGRMIRQNTTPNIHRTEFRDLVLGGNYQTQITKQQLENQLCK